MVRIGLGLGRGLRVRVGVRVSVVTRARVPGKAPLLICVWVGNSCRVIAMVEIVDRQEKRDSGHAIKVATVGEIWGRCSGHDIRVEAVGPTGE